MNDIILSDEPSPWYDFSGLMKVINMPVNLLASHQGAMPREQNLF